MPSCYSLKEPLNPSWSKKPLGVNEAGVSIFECLRLLLGTVNLVHKPTGKLVRLRHCFLTDSKRRISRKTIDDVVRVIFDGDLSAKDVSGYLSRGGVDN